MSEETAAASASPVAATPKKKAKSAGAKPKNPQSNHPKVSEMVISAITILKERGGSSLQAIKKHIAANHKVDIDRLTPFIKKCLKSSVASGTLVQTKGKGATGSFKLSASGQKSKEPKKTVKKVKKETASPTKKAKSPAKKVAKPKAKAEKKKPAAKKAATATKKAAKPKSPKKAKATKPKAPKAKKLKTPKKAAPKKAAKK